MPAETSIGGGSSASKGHRRKRPYGNACIPCRIKKRSCDGQRPACSNCLSNKEDCVIPPPGRFLRHGSIDRQPGSHAHHVPLVAQTDNVGEAVALLTELVHRIDHRLQRIEGEWSEPYRRLSEDEFSQLESRGQEFDADSTEATTHAGPAHRITESSSSGSGAKYRLTVDGLGNVTYHGVTGLNQGQEIPISPAHAIEQPVGTTSVFPVPSLADTVSQNQALAPIFQALAASKHISVAPELGDALINAFHCYEVFEITEQAAFLRDMVLGGSCYSELLLMVLYASASRMIDGLTEEQKLAQGDLFVKLAKAYLYKDLEGPSRITTIQALLLLSSRECALGETSQGWNHAGLAFRMIQDLGIHHNPESVSGVSNLSLEEQATRDRVFWAAFVWDKALSLALGREPTLSPRPGADPSNIPTFTNDDDPWVPYFANPLNCPPSLQGYVYPRSSRSVAFRLIARLCVIVHDIIMGLYSNDSRDNVPHIRAVFVRSTRKRLDGLWNDVPSHMRVGIDEPSPPPHIFMFLIFFHASYILLHRPTVNPKDIATASGPVIICLEHSKAATEQATRFGKTFGDYMRYLPRYSWFVAASFDVVLLDCDVAPVQGAALERLTVWLQTMEKNLLRAPSIKRSVQHISSRIYEVLAKNLALAQTPMGRSVKAFLLRQRGMHVLPSPGTAWMANESFEFFDLLQNEGEENNETFGNTAFSQAKS